LAAHEWEPGAGWKEAVSSLSRYPNISVGISAVYDYSQQASPHEDTWPWIEFLLQKLGPERCMCGSDFPLLLDTDRYCDYSAVLFDDAVGVSSAG
jgi:predicted TIM-barrel fold metal-dependent hydrolase